LSDVDVLVLAGGLGTRLRGVLPDRPKILAPVLGKPFLEYLIRWLALQGCRRLILSLGYRAEDVLLWLESFDLPSVEIQTVVEPEPMGTGGAIAFAARAIASDPVLVLNGDTVVDADLNAFLLAHSRVGTKASILCAAVDNAGRYGAIEIDDHDRVARFVEKSEEIVGSHWINAGFYLFNRDLVCEIERRLRKGSLERDILERMPAGSIGACRTKGCFLDIGTPETLAQASQVLSRMSDAGVKE
jgi:NDP-sugar pyrophosphorylase family protein